MFDIKKVKLKTAQQAVFVTEDNYKEFINYAYPGDFNIDDLKLYKSADVLVTGLHLRHGYNKCIILNHWYVCYGYKDWHDEGSSDMFNEFFESVND